MHFYFDISNYLDLAIKIIGLLISIWTLRIAVLIFKNLDIKKDFTKKQFNTTLSLARVLESTDIHIKLSNDNSNPFVSSIFPSFLIDEETEMFYKQIEKCGDYKVFFEKDRKDEFAKFEKNIFLIDNFYTHLLEVAMSRDPAHKPLVGYIDSLPPNSVFILFRRSSTIEDFTKIEFVESYVNLNKYLKDSSKAFYKLKSEIVIWLTNFGVQNLNIASIDYFRRYDEIEKDFIKVSNKYKKH